MKTIHYQQRDLRFLRELGQVVLMDTRMIRARYFAQEMNWGNAAIGKINSVLHGLEADIKAGASTDFIRSPPVPETGIGHRTIARHGYGAPSRFSWQQL